MQPGAQIDVGGVPNLRDLGGWTVPGGTVRPGQVYRSAEFSDLAGPALAAFDRLGIATVVDLRTGAERDLAPNVVPSGVRYEVLDVLADAEGIDVAAVGSILADPSKAKELLGGGQVTTLLAEAYRDIVSLPSAQAAYRSMFTMLADDTRRPLLFHCTTGKDRTGWGAASLLLLLGVDPDDVRAEYLLTNEQLLPALKPVFDQFETAGGDPVLLRPLLGVEPEYLATALDEMTTRWGTVERYFTDALGLTDGQVDALRARLIASG